MLRVGIWMESLTCAGSLLLQWQGENFGDGKNLNFCLFQPVHCANKNPISPKVFNRFSKSLPQLEKSLGWALGWKVSGALIFCFCNGKVKSLRVDNIWNLAVFNLYTVPAKSCISKSIQPIFEIFASARRCLGLAFWWKVLRAWIVYFCNGKVKTLGIENIWIFASFNLFTVPAKIPYLQKYSIDFRNICFRLKIFRVGIWVESFRCAGILLLQWQGENFEHRQHLRFCHFQLVHCGSKNSIPRKVFNRFSKSSPELEDVEGGH